jgi:hypothetical protein
VVSDDPQYGRWLGYRIIFELSEMFCGLISQGFGAFCFCARAGGFQDIWLLSEIGFGGALGVAALYAM